MSLFYSFLLFLFGKLLTKCTRNTIVVTFFDFVLTPVTVQNKLLLFDCFVDTFAKKKDKKIEEIHVLYSIY